MFAGACSQARCVVPAAVPGDSHVQDCVKGVDPSHIVRGARGGLPGKLFDGNCVVVFLADLWGLVNNYCGFWLDHWPLERWFWLVWGWAEGRGPFGRGDACLAVVPAVGRGAGQIDDPIVKRTPLALLFLERRFPLDGRPRPLWGWRVSLHQCFNPLDRQLLWWRTEGRGPFGRGGACLAVVPTAGRGTGQIDDPIVKRAPLALQFSCKG